MGKNAFVHTLSEVVWDSSISGVFPAYLLPTENPLSDLSSLLGGLLGGRGASCKGLCPDIC